MMERNDYINKVAEQNSFSVPDGYFERFVPELMDKLPQRAFVTELRPRRRLMKIRIVACAACILAGAVSALFYFNRTSLSGHTHVTGAGSQYVSSVETEAYDDAVADYAMIDNTDIYAYLSEGVSEY